MSGISPLAAEVRVPGSATAAFEAFTGGFGAWWPREFSWSGDDLATIGFEHSSEHVLYELSAEGLRWDWGRVLRWQPPELLVFSWQIGPDRVPVARADQSSEVEVRCSDAGDGQCVVSVEHRAWERHGEAGAAYRKSMEQAWPYALEAFRRFTTL